MSRKKYFLLVWFCVVSVFPTEAFTATNITTESGSNLDPGKSNTPISELQSFINKSASKARICIIYKIDPNFNDNETKEAINLVGIAREIKNSIESELDFNFDVEIADNIAVAQNRQCKSQNYEILLEVKEVNGLLVANVRILLSQAGKIINEFTEHGVLDDGVGPNKLAKKIAKIILIQIGMNIRVKLDDFAMLGDSSKYKQLARTIPYILGVGLSESPRIILLSNRDRASKLLDRASESQASVNDETIAEQGKVLQPNYVIIGDYAEVDGSLYISIRCLSIETGQIIISKDVILNPIKLPGLRNKLTQVAVEVRAAIDKDYIRRKSRQKFVALTAVPPVPNTTENQEILLEMVHMASKNLSLIIRDLKDHGAEICADSPETCDKKYYSIAKKYEIVENSRLVRQSVTSDIPFNRWIAGKQLGADIIMVFSLDRSNLDRFDLHLDVYNSAAPRAINTFDVSSDPEGITKMIRDILVKLVNKNIDELSDTERKHWESTEIKRWNGKESIPAESYVYRGLNKELSFALHVGASIRNDDKLFSGLSQGLLFDFGVVWNPFDSSRWSLEPLKLRFDFMGSNGAGDRTVYGTDLIILNTIYRFKPLFSRSYYIGGGFGFLGVLRNAPDDLILDMTPGGGVFLGFMHRLRSSRIVDFRLEYSFAFSDVSPREIGGIEYDGGWPGSWYITIGTLFDL